MIYVIFGYPGVGKTFVGEILAKKYGFYFYDADEDLPEDMRQRLKKKEKISESMRDVFFENIFQRLTTLHKKYKDIVVSQTFMKERHRRKMQNHFPGVQFILITTPDKIREERLQSRIEYPLDITYSRHMVKNFDLPQIAHSSVDNSLDGDIYVKKQLQSILNSENQ